VALTYIEFDLDDDSNWNKEGEKQQQQQRREKIYIYFANNSQKNILQRDKKVRDLFIPQ
jgi:hypothetical protein